MAETLDHRTELLPFIVLEAEDDKHALGDFERPVEALMVLATYPEIVARDVIEALGRVVQHGHLMVEGEGDPAAVAHLLNETDIIGAENPPATFDELQTEVEIDTIDKQLVGEAANGLPG